MIMISTWLPKVMRLGKRKNAATANSQGNSSSQRKRWRRMRYCAALSRAPARPLPCGVASLTAEESGRLDQEDGGGNRIDEQIARDGKHVLAAGIENADHQRGEQRAFEAAEAADGDDDEEQHEVKHGKRRRQAEQLNGEPAAKRRKAGAQSERQREQLVDIDADRFRHAPIVDGGADFRADIGALEAVPEHGDEHGADCDQKGAVAGELAEAKVDVAFQPSR